MLYRSVVLAALGAALLNFSAQAQIVINEVCANNGSALSPGGTAADYVEIYNNGTTPRILTDWALSDDVRTNKYPFPMGTTIAAKGRLLVWLDSVTNYPGLIATNFSLRASGEEVVLFEGVAQRDRIIFGPQINDKVLCRIPDGAANWTLGKTTPGATNIGITLGVPTALRINELLATNSLGDDWLELYNPATNPPVAMGLMVFSQTNTATNLPAPAALYPNSFIDSDAFVQFDCVKATSRGNYLDFRLSSTSGETITLFASDRTTVIDVVTFGPQAGDTSYGRLPNGGTNFFLFPSPRLTPGAPNDWLPITNILVSEVLTHTDLPLEDAIELENMTDAPVDISYWWISNSRDDPFKFRVPDGTIIPAHGFKVFFEQAGAAAPGFNHSGTGESPDFTLNSAHGDEVILTAGTVATVVTGARGTRDLPAAANGVAITRYTKSNGGTDMVPESRRTLGQDNPASVAHFRLGTGLPNAYPLVGPIVITEIMYHPPDIIAGGVTNDNALDEYIELTSITNVSVPLYDPDYRTNTWHVEGGVSYRFPTNRSVAAGGKIILVNFDPVTNLTQLADFRAKFGVSTNVPLFGPYEGKLNNSSDSIELYRPDAVQLAPHPDAGFVPSILVEKVKYEQTNGWPATADGGGFSLHRLSATGYANDETNWFGAAPSPGVLTLLGSPPTVTVPPLTQTVPAGSTVTLSVSNTGTAPFSYQWQFHGAMISGATSPSLVLTNTRANQGGTYSVTISNAYGSASSAATLTVAQPPSILTPPASVTTTQGFGATFSVVAEGSVPFSYQWRFNGGNLAGATSSSLTLSGVQTAQAGGYTVVAANLYGSITSIVATLTVGVPASFTSMPADQFVAVGTTASFTITDTGTPPLSLQWLCHGTNLPGATFPTLMLTNVQTNQSDFYYATLANAFGSTTSAVARLSVAGPPWLLPLPLPTNAIPYVTLSGLTGHVYEVQGTPDLINWFTVSRFTNSSSEHTIADPGATNAPYRFYRGRLVN